MASHICTTASLYAGGIELEPSECLICGSVSKQIGGYVGVYCPVCRRDWSWEMWRGDIVEKRRRLLRLSRRDIGGVVGIAGSKIKRMELRSCPDWYWNKTLELVKKQEVE